MTLDLKMTDSERLVLIQKLIDNNATAVNAVLSNTSIIMQQNATTMTDMRDLVAGVKDEIRKGNESRKEQTDVFSAALKAMGSSSESSASTIKEVSKLKSSSNVELFNLLKWVIALVVVAILGLKAEKIAEIYSPYQQVNLENIQEN